VVSQLLTELDRASDNPNLVVLAATNRGTHSIQRCSGRTVRDAHRGAPSPTARRARKILDVHTRTKPLVEGVDLEHLADETEGSGAEIASLCPGGRPDRHHRASRTSTVRPPNDHADEVGITADDFAAALETVRPATP